jgi:hypothetical protein
VWQTWGAGVYIAAEGAPYNTGSVSNVTVNGGTLSETAVGTDIVHGAVLVYSGYAAATVSNVTISNLSILNTPQYATRSTGIIVDAGRVSGIVLKNISLTNSALPAFYTNAPAGSYTVSGYTYNGNPINVS